MNFATGAAAVPDSQVMNVMEAFFLLRLLEMAQTPEKLRAQAG